MVLAVINIIGHVRNVYDDDDDDDDEMSLTFSLRRHGQNADAGAAGAVSEDGDAVWVAAERSDVELNPAKSLDLIPKTVVAHQTRVARRQEPYSSRSYEEEWQR